MKDDVRKVVYTTVAVFVIGVLIWIGFIFVNACGFSFACNQGQLDTVRTPIPTVGHAPVPALMVSQADTEQCQVYAVDLLGAWVSVGASETEAFSFNDVDGDACAGTYADDVRPLFVEANLWYPGSFSCASCHSADLAKTSAAKLDLTTYAGILAGSQRESAEDTAGTDILGGGTWESSLLYQFTYEHPVLPPGHGDTPSMGPIVFAGKASPSPAPTPTP
ncbi:MAG: hypothetical protein AB1649_13700 [Chloroflexota bacterium]